MSRISYGIRLGPRFYVRRTTGMCPVHQVFTEAGTCLGMVFKSEPEGDFRVNLNSGLPVFRNRRLLTEADDPRPKEFATPQSAGIALLELFLALRGSD